MRKGSLSGFQRAPGKASGQSAQRVRLATQLFSQSVGIGIATYLPRRGAQAEAVLTTARWFDINNSRTPHDAKPERCGYGITLAAKVAQDGALAEVEKLAVHRQRLAIKKSYSIENGYPARRRSLVDDAKFETSINKETRQEWLSHIRQSENDEDLSEEEVLLAASSPTDESAAGPLNIVLVLSIKSGMNSLGRIIKTIESHHGSLQHIESRASRRADASHQVLLRITLLAENLRQLTRSLRQSAAVTACDILNEATASIKEPWYPRHISELDQCNHLMTKYEPDLDMDHPGFADAEYRKRRHAIASIAFSYRHGEPIPRVQYTASEVETWRQVYTELMRCVPTGACSAYRSVMQLLQRECGYSADHVPQLEDVSKFMQRRTGFVLRPVAGLLTARDFLASLAFRVFQCTQYVRHHSSPHHSPEPDCIHELLGHAPLLAEPFFAEFSQELGLASLGATDEEIERFATVYWFTVEFGLCREGGELRAYGAGLLSSYGELEHSLSSRPQHLPFEPTATSVQPYQDQDYQDVYFVAESLLDAQDKFRRWVATSLSRPYEVWYNPHTQTVERVDDVNKVGAMVSQLHGQLIRLNSAVQKMKF
ncbi:tyrosine 3-monooxygenase-like [Pollicipes pollicipes]|uniref:tyrosine 3-monooxygenase-like n=1 Tax=Pollicipes pollicipes TaxID=41117 RepID=UPI001884D882|nr:tyrosine 3-monooxygenase-like [Pollicipes pollicipes]